MELYAINEALGIVLKNGQVGLETSRIRVESRSIRMHIWADSQAVIKRLQHTAHFLGQWLTRYIIESNRQLGECGTVVEVD